PFPYTTLFRSELPVASTVEGPRAAEGAVPRTAARELDRCARIEVADEVLLPSPHQIASRREIVERWEEAWRWPRALDRDHPRDLLETGLASAARHGLEEHGGDTFSLAAHDAIDGAFGVVEDLERGEGGAMPPNEDEGVGQPAAHLLREVDHLRNVGEVVESESDGIRLERVELLEEIHVAEDLEIEDTHVVSGATRRRSHELDAERLEPQIDLRVHQAA